MTEVATAARRPYLLAGKRAWVLGLLVAAVLCASALRLSPAQLIPSGSGFALLREFAWAALTPALDYEAPVPEGTAPLALKVLDSLRSTLVFAAAGLSLAVAIGLPLGALASTAWWSRAADDSLPRGGVRKLSVPVLFLALRTWIAGMRSIHELLWAVLLLAALGLTPFSAVCAIAIPYAGTLAKVFSELLDEAPRDGADALRDAGASRLQAFLFGIVPRAVPDLASYVFYRLECAVRSSAVLGFFGFPTVGYHLQLAFDNQHYHEVWTYLWALIAVAFLFEALSSSLRKRVVLR